MVLTSSLSTVCEYGFIILYACTTRHFPLIKMLLVMWFAVLYAWMFCHSSASQFVGQIKTHLAFVQNRHHRYISAATDEVVALEKSSQWDSSLLQSNPLN